MVLRYWDSDVILKANCENILHYFDKFTIIGGHAKKRELKIIVDVYRYTYVCNLLTVGVVLFYMCMVLYLYGDLAIYAVAVPKSLRDVLW